MRYIFILSFMFCSFLSIAKVQNDSELLTSLIAEGIKQNSVIDLGANKTYNVDKNFLPIKLLAGQKLQINGNGSTIIFTNNSGQIESVLFDIIGAENTEVYIKNLKINGSSNPQQFATRIYNNLRLSVAIRTLSVPNISLSNIQIDGFYGRGIYSTRFKNFNADNLKFNKVGGKWLRGDGHDAFGDAIYLGYNSADAVANINNSSFIGYPDIEDFGGFYKNLSRAGVVAEFNKTNHLLLNINNTTIEGFHRGVHIEASNTTLNMNKTTINRYGCGVFVFGYATKEIFINNSKFLNPYKGGEFGSAKGVVTSYASNCKAVVKNSIIKGDYFWRENEMNVRYENSSFTFNETGIAPRSAIFKKCKFYTKVNLTNQFGKISK